ncbi:MAG TPA: hypothetical protein VFP46_00545, partial [Candidatus Paceibacterota bacterium]|nr:hypothetical protein [Candidatus Paceibacterota bacterium]
MNFLGLLVDKGLLAPADKRAVEQELAQKKSLSEALSFRGISLESALNEVGKAYGLPGRVLGEAPANQEVFQY